MRACRMGPDASPKHTPRIKPAPTQRSPRTTCPKALAPDPLRRSLRESKPHTKPKTRTWLNPESALSAESPNPKSERTLDSKCGCETTDLHTFDVSTYIL